MVEGATRLLHGGGGPSEGAASRPPVDFINDSDPSGGFPFMNDPDRFWRLEPNRNIPDTSETTNSEGDRGPARATGAAARRRVLCLGDSNTFGIGVSDDATFARRLERFLTADEPGSAMVINAGVPGYTIYQMYQTLVARFESIRPTDVVLYAGAFNDYLPAVGADDERLALRIRDWNARRSHLLRKSATFRMFAAWFSDDEGGRSPAARRSTLTNLQRGFFAQGARPDGPRVPPEMFERYIQRIHAYVKSNGATLTIVVPPLPAKSRAAMKDSDLYAGIVRNFGKNNYIAVLDARELLTVKGGRDRHLFADGVHPSPEGHTLIAAGLARCLVPGSEAVENFTRPVLLKTLQLKAIYQKGAPPAPADVAAAVAESEDLLVVSCPSLLQFPEVEIPPAAALVFAVHCLPGGTKEDPGLVDVRWTIRAEVDGASTTLFTREERFPHGYWTTPRRERIDLSEFNGKKLKITFETAGDMERVSYGPAAIHAYH